MFEKLFKYVQVITRHKQAPFAAEREKFLQHRSSTGAAETTLLRIARELLVIVKYLELSRRPITVNTVEKAALKWANFQQDRRRASTASYSYGLFKQLALEWLLYLGWLKLPSQRPLPYSVQIESFKEAMRKEFGFSETTVRNYSWHLEQFLQWFHHSNCQFSDISITDIDQFLLHKSQGGWSRVSVVSCTHALRTFLRYAFGKGWCENIANGIISPRIFKEENLPLGPTWENVQKIIALTNTDDPRDIRDKAILILLATYGLRSGEIINLQLEDFDWDQGLVRVRRSKHRCVQTYPITNQFSAALINYLRRVRPSCLYRTVFLSLKAPVRPLSRSALYHITQSRIKKLDIPTIKKGPHSLRHACATHLLSEGCTMKEIADHLGHAELSSTRIYAKVDMNGLREVANFDLGGLS